MHNSVYVAIAGEVVNRRSVLLRNLSNDSDSKSIQVVIEPKYNLYSTPCIEWGVTRSQIKTQYGNPDTEDSNGIGYKTTSSSAPVIIFVFDNNQKLKSSGVLVKSAYASILADFLLESYLRIIV